MLKEGGALLQAGRGFRSSYWGVGVGTDVTETLETERLARHVQPQPSCPTMTQSRPERTPPRAPGSKAALGEEGKGLLQVTTTYKQP